MNKKRMAFLGLLLMAMVGSSAASCNDNKYTEPFKDAPRSGHDDASPMSVIQMSDGFNNIGVKCVIHDGIYTTYHGDHPYGSIFIVPNDPNCPQR